MCKGCLIALQAPVYQIVDSQDIDEYESNFFLQYGHYHFCGKAVIW